MNRPEEVRAEAERRLQELGGRVSKGTSPEELLHELQVHQIELEMQNEELRNANDALQEVTRRYQDLYDLAPVGYLTLGHQAQILQVNLTGAALLGRPCGELVGANLHDHLHREDQDVLYLHLRRVYRDRRNGTHACEVRLLNPQGGEQRFMRLQSQRQKGEPESVRTTMTEVTEARLAHAELERAHRFADRIVNTVRHPLVVLDGQWRVVTASAAYYRAFHAAPASTEGGDFFQIAGGRWDLPSLRSALEHLLVSGREFDDLEVEGQFPGLARAILLVSGRVLPEAEEAGRRALVVFEDVTARKDTERRLRSALVRLERANAELEEYALAVSHDLRAPLRVIHHYAEFLAEDLAGYPDRKVRQYVTNLHEAITQSERMVEDLLKLARLGRSVELGPVDLGALLEEVIASLDLPREAEVRRGDEWPRVTADVTLLRQVLANLIGNAVRHNDSPHKLVEVGWRPVDQELWELIVRDNGPGIDAADRERIFQPFRRLKSEGQGVGLGLALVRKAAGRLGGSVRVESSSGEGCTFCIRLPFNPADRI